MAEVSVQGASQLDAQGRLLVPASLRRSLHLKAGDRLIIRIENNRLVIERAEDIKRRLKQRFAHLPKDLSLADELSAERQLAAERENEA